MTRDRLTDAEGETFRSPRGGVERHSEPRKDARAEPTPMPPGDLKVSPTGEEGVLSLLALLQLTDSAFPSGAFTHSYGLEQVIRDRRVASSTNLERFVTSVLRYSVATADAPSAYAAALAAKDHDLARILLLDGALYRTKAASELRSAMLQTGRRLLVETAAHSDSVLLQRYLDEVNACPTLGAHPIAFGVSVASLGVNAPDVAPALMLGIATAMLLAAMRLMPISHRDVQAILHSLRPLLAGLASRLQPEQPLLSFHPIQEIASMKHSRAPVRLFAS